MKKTLLFGFLFIVFSLAGLAQGVYSKENLKKASQEDLDLYLEKAVKTTRTGAIFSVAGSTAFFSALVFISVSSGSSGSEESFRFGYGLAFAGFCSSAIGLPILLTGSSRIKKVIDAKNTSKGAASIKLNPSAFYNYEAHKFEPGVNFTIRF
jgi:hypothetical protein